MSNVKRECSKILHKDKVLGKIFEHFFERWVCKFLNPPKVGDIRRIISALIDEESVADEGTHLERSTKKRIYCPRQLSRSWILVLEVCYSITWENSHSESHLYEERMEIRFINNSERLLSTR